MTYSYLRPRIAQLIPSFTEEQLNTALPLGVAAVSGLGGIGYNAVAPLDLDPVGVAIGTGLALGAKPRSPYNYLGMGALGLEGARYINNAFTEGNDANPNPLIALGLGAGAIGLREGLKTGVINLQDLGFGGDIATAPPKPPKTPPSPSSPKPKPRVAKDGNEAPANPSTGQVDVEVPAPRVANGVDIESYLDKSPLLDREKARKYADPNNPEFSPHFVSMITQDGMSDELRGSLSFVDDILARNFKDTGIAPPAVYDPVKMPIPVDAFQYHPHKLNADVLVVRNSRLEGGEGKSRLVNEGKAANGILFPNVVTSTPQSLERLGLYKQAPTPDDNGFFIRNSDGIYSQVLDANQIQLEAAYNQLRKSGRLAVPPEYKNPVMIDPLNLVWMDEVGGASKGSYDPTEFYGLRSSKRRARDVDGNLYYKGVWG